MKKILEMVYEDVVDGVEGISEEHGENNAWPPSVSMDFDGFVH